MAFAEKMDDKERIQFAKQIEYMYEAARPGWPKLLTFAFLRGIASGLGIFLGGTLVVALLLWALSGLGHVPFLNGISHSVQHTLQQGKTPTKP